MTTGSGFDRWFRRVSGFEPRRWQSELAEDAGLRSRLIRIPTGFGKTLGVVGAWVYHRLVRGDESWPRRLVFVLPMRVLVEQVAAEAQGFLRDAGLLLEPSDIGREDDAGPGATVHTLLGGSAPAPWHLDPERPAVIVGTQDMLLSRALNRGYASPRPRWPIEFALLGQDSLWVLDEVQLMGVGLTTSVVLERLRREDEMLRPAASWWMSATLQPDWLQYGAGRNPEVLPATGSEPRTPTLHIPPEERTGPLFEVTKPVRLVEVARNADAKAASWADIVWDAHATTPADAPACVTLAICNTVDDACALCAALEKRCDEHGTELRLVHSRFRGLERATWATTFLRRDACTNGADRILVATQVVEAGVDISATTLVTQLAPWASLVQRFGRCARYGGEGRVVVVDRSLEAKQCAPYGEQELAGARHALERLDDVGPASLERFEDELRAGDPGALAALYPFEPLHVLTRSDYEELFDTEADLTGADLDVGRFIREGDERDLSVAWIDLAGASAPAGSVHPTREGLCPVPVERARKWLMSEGRPRDGRRAWVWDFLDGAWRRAYGRDLRPGQVVVVDQAAGGYEPDVGFTGKPRGRSASPLPLAGTWREPAREELGELGPEHEETSAYPYKTIATHGAEVAREVARVGEALGLPADLIAHLALAGSLHDVGKCHPVFVRACNPAARKPSLADRTDLAKAPTKVWRRGRNMFCAEGGTPRRGFRHELASTLMLFEWLRSLDPYHPALLGPYVPMLEAGVLGSDAVVPLAADETRAANELEAALLGLEAGEFDLVAYLVCSHHGKVRGTWSGTPQDQELTASRPDLAPIRGVVDGDTTPSLRVVTLEGSMHVAPATELHLDLAGLGLSARYGASWRERVERLRERWGARNLAFLEALLRAADVRASRLDTLDPLLESEATA